MRILVTGGAGFIGSNFVKYLINSYPSYCIKNIDALTYAGNLENLIEVENNEKYEFIKGDITNRALIDSIFQKGVDAVVHFAAESHVDRSIIEPDIFVKTNILGTQVLLDVAKKYGLAKFVHVSTDEVYGSLGTNGFFHETTPLAPNSPYSASKAASDLLVLAYNKTFNLPINITRCSNNYGPCQFPEKLIPLMIIRALDNKPLPIYGDGLNIRDWLHVEDHCRAIDMVLHDGENGQIYNIGGHNERTNIEIAKTILKYMGKPESLIHYVEDRPGHDRRYAIDATKIGTKLGWKPQNNFEEGIKETIDWYLSNKPWWSRIISGEYLNYFQQQYAERLGELS